MLFNTSYLTTKIYPQYVKYTTILTSLNQILVFNTVNVLYTWNAFQYADQYWFLYTNKITTITQPTLLLYK